LNVADCCGKQYIFIGLATDSSLIFASSPHCTSRKHLSPLPAKQPAASLGILFVEKIK